jgi:hypothetical protein
MTSVELDGSALKSSVAFTGRLACMSRTEAFDVVRQRGGTPSPAVTKRTQVVIVGELGWPLLDDGRPSNKLSRATALGIPIVSERRFLEWVGKTVPHDVQKTYSAQQLAALSKMSTSMIQELAQLSLLDERDGRFGFRDLASARQIAKAAQRRGSPLGNHPRRQRNPAVLVAPDYIDAMFNLALLLQRNGAFAEAADYWRRYLAHDRASECAARARRSLKFCEIQVKFLACASGSADSDKAA